MRREISVELAVDVEDLFETAKKLEDLIPGVEKGDPEELSILQRIIYDIIFQAQEINKTLKICG